MAVAHNAHAENLDSTTPSTIAVTVVSTANRVAIAWVFGNAWDEVGAPAATFAGNAMTLLGQKLTAATRFTVLFAIKGDANIPTGSQTVSITLAGSMSTVGCGVIVFDGADQTTGWQNFTTSGPTASVDEAITINSANGNMICACGADDNAAGRTINGGTSAFEETASDGNYLASYRASTGASQSLGWTLGSSVSWAMTGVDVIAFGAGGGDLSVGVGAIGEPVVGGSSF